MNEEQLEIINKVIDAATAKAIKVHVNGKIDKLTDVVEEEKLANSVHRKEMQPIIDGWRAVESLRSFTLWIAAPLLTLGALVALFKN